METGNGRARMRDVTGDGDESHFGPEQEPTRRPSRNEDEDDAYNVPPRESRNQDRVSSQPQQEPTRRASHHVEDDPTEDDLTDRKTEYTDDDFKGEVIASKEMTVFPEDIYEAKCVDVIPMILKDKYRKNALVPKIKFVFEIINDPDYSGQKISRIVNKHFSNQSTMVEWYGKIIGESVEKGMQIDIRNCKGKECRISVKEYTSKEDGEKKCKIDDILSKKKRA